MIDIVTNPLFLRATLGMLYAIVFVALVFLHWHEKRYRVFTVILIPLALTYVVFYVAIIFYQPVIPSPFFTSLSLYRSWATVIAALLLLAPLVKNTWNGTQ